ncbi:MlaD family protein [Patulibacter brassicae]|uniref:MlaD family protein n=1 Tax=Patulibacter brassicae TaxID=1705717 RepID=A0ABU4VQC1_9ACTN|nr:MlaD family protein [Patulibacter brassicae]MDX8153660.1 MlaD family protein [Patulibacter brassicae]
MNKQGARPAQIVMMILFALSCFGLLLFLWTAFGGPVPLKARQYEVQASFSSGSQLATYSDVRISGVSVGKVVKIEREGGNALTRIKIDPEFAPLPRDTRATLRTKTLVGETFVQLSFGSRRGPAIPEGGTIASSRIQPPVDIDRLFDVFDPTTRRALKRVLPAVASATRDRGAALNKAFGNLQPTVESTDGLLRILDRQRRAVRTGFRDAGLTFQSIGRQAGAVQVLAREGSALFSSLRASSDGLQETIRALPPFLDDTRSALRVARTFAGDAGPTIAALRPVTPLVRPALRDLNALAPDLASTLQKVDPVLDRVPSGTRALRSVLDAAGPFVNAAEPVTANLLPTARYLQMYKNDLAVTLGATAASTQAKIVDLNGVPRHYLRLITPLNGELLEGAPKRLPTNRHNAYPKPGTLNDLGSLKSFDCAQTSNPGGVLSALVDGNQAPPCVKQGPFDIDGRITDFPQLRKATPPASRAKR